MLSVGRPRVLDDVKRREICALVSVGCDLDTAAKYVGCSPSTIRREALRNEDFHDKLRAAELSGQVEPLRAVRSAASTSWRAAAWLLERTNPRRFGRRDAAAYSEEEVSEILDYWVEVVFNELDGVPDIDGVYARILALGSTAKRDAFALRHTRRSPAKRIPRDSLGGHEKPHAAQTRSTE
jgi:hypothetical protein